MPNRTRPSPNVKTARQVIYAIYSTIPDMRRIYVGQSKNNVMDRLSTHVSATRQVGSGRRKA